MIMHTIPLPAELDQEISKRASDEMNAIWLDSFDEFVANLFKQYDDVALTLHHATTGVATEAGELLSISKAAWIYGRAIDHTNVVEEVFDVLFYIQAIMNLYQLDRSQVLSYGIAKLRARYPEGFNELDANRRRDKAAGEPQT